MSNQSAPSRKGRVGNSHTTKESNVNEYSPLTVGEYVSPCLDLDDHEVRSISTLLSCYPINHASRGGVFGMANEGIVQR